MPRPESSDCSSFLLPSRPYQRCRSRPRATINRGRRVRRTLRHSATPVASSDFAAKAIEVFKEGCRADLDAYCSQVTPGDQRLLACLYAHNDKVFARCKGSVLDALLLVKVEFAQANFIGALCGSGILDHCGGVEPGDGRILLFDLASK